MNALNWILLAVALVAVGCAVYARIDRDNWKTRAEIAEAAGLVNLKKRNRRQMRWVYARHQKRRPAPAEGNRAGTDEGRGFLRRAGNAGRGRL